MQFINQVKLLLLSVITFISLKFNAQEIQLVKEFSGLNSIDHLIKFNNKLFFSANNGINGEELWASDGTQDGTVLLKDIVSGSASSSPEFLKVCGDKIYFIAKDPANTARKALFQTDGTSNGTIKIITLSADLNGITANNYFEYYNGKVYFKHDGDNQGFELWSTDGTVSGTQLVNNIFPGSGSSNPDYFYVFGGKLFFNAEDDLNGKELWNTDGSSSGTILVSTGNVDNTVFGPRFMTEYNGKLYYEYDGELWSSNGGSASLFLQINPGFKSDPRNFLVHNGQLFFSAKRNGIAHELFICDGTPAGTSPVLTDINGYFAASLLSAYGDLFYSGFSDFNGQELWKSDGTNTNTNLYYNLNNDVPTVSNGLEVNNEMIAVNDTIYLNGSSENGVKKLFYTTGSDNLLTAIDYNLGTSANGNPKNLINFNNELYFIANYTANQGLYKIGLFQTNSIQEEDKNIFGVYPNPFDEGLTILNNTQDSNFKIELLSFDGKIIETLYNNSDLITKNLSSGVYYIRFTNESSTQLIKVLKNK